MKRFVISAACMLVMLFSGCASNSSRYEWSTYETALYQHYRNPGDATVFSNEIKACLVKAESKGKVPPGLYAEYGYIMLDARNYDEAMVYFQKESDQWPESRAFMAKMINNANKAKAASLTAASEE